MMREWLLTPERVAIYAAEATAVLADLHLGYAQARQRSGEAVPLRSLDEILAPLGRVVARHEVRQVVIAGDLFEEAYRPDLAAELGAWLKAAKVEFVGLVPGNHDRGLERNLDLPL